MTRILPLLLLLSTGALATTTTTTNPCNGLPDGAQCGAFIGGCNELTPSTCYNATCGYSGCLDTVGTGTISSSGTTVTGSGTFFFTELQPGYSLFAGSRQVTVVSIASETSLVTRPAFSPALSAGTTFTFKPPLVRVTDSNGVEQLTISRTGQIVMGDSLVVAPIAQPSSSSGTGYFGDSLTLASQAGGASSGTSTTAGGSGAAVFGTANGGNGTGTNTSGGAAGNTTIASGDGGNATGSGTNGNAGSVVIYAGVKGTGGSGGMNGSVAIGGTNKANLITVRNNRLGAPFVRYNTVSVSVASTSLVQLDSYLVSLQTGLDTKIYFTLNIDNQAGASRNYTIQIMRGGTGCSDATNIGTFYGTAASSFPITITGTIYEASPGGTVTYRVCGKSSSATGTQNAVYVGLDVLEY